MRPTALIKPPRLHHVTGTAIVLATLSVCIVGAAIACRSIDRAARVVRTEMDMHSEATPK